MGQPITVMDVTVEGDFAAFHADRSITGQDGLSFETADQAVADGSYPGDLAARILEFDSSIDHVFVASNQVVVRRFGGWESAALDAASGMIEAFFVFYSEG